jgi:hypothetical protein
MKTAGQLSCLLALTLGSIVSASAQQTSPSR